MTFDDFDPDQLALIFIDSLRLLGYRTSSANQQNKAPSRYFTARHNGRGVRISIRIMENPTIKNFMIVAKTRDDRGVYHLVHPPSAIHEHFAVRLHEQSPHSLLPNVLAKFIKEITVWLHSLHGQLVTKPLTKYLSQLSRPLRFQRASIATIADRHGGLELTNLYRDCVVLGIVTINNDLRLNPANINKPGIDCWFHIIGAPAPRESSARLELIVQKRRGELVYYPVRSGKISDQFRAYGTAIDYRNFTKLDRKLIELTITRYVGVISAV